MGESPNGYRSLGATVFGGRKTSLRPKDLASSQASSFAGEPTSRAWNAAGQRRSIVDVNAMPPARVGSTRPFLLDRVRVLGGPLAGSEGWVLEYGLREQMTSDARKGRRVTPTASSLHNERG